MFRNMTRPVATLIKAAAMTLLVRLSHHSTTIYNSSLALDEAELALLAAASYPL